MINEVTFKNKMKQQLRKVLVWLLGLFFLMFILRMFEWFYLSLGTGFSNVFYNELMGVIRDLIDLSPWILLLALASWLLSLLKSWIGLVFFLLVSLSFLIFQLGLVIYFEEALLPLDYSSIATMSSAQVTLILEIYGFSSWQLIFLFPVYALFISVWKVGTFMGRYKILRLIILLALFVSASIKLIAEEPTYYSEQAGNLQRNKGIYFVQSYFDYYQNLDELLGADLRKVLERYYAYHPDIDASDYYKYPFFSTKNSENHLGEYFNQVDQKPNVVFIIGESLGRIYSGKGSKLGSFTPFLDSLADQGLYWENALSNAERTFGAIPNLMGGVPEGRVGFLNLKSSMPNHLSLPLLLKDRNGYETSFYCGADSTFDNMVDYLMFQKFDNIYGVKSFSRNENLSAIVDKDGKEKNFNWGAEDLTVFNESMQKMLSDSVQAPFFNLYLTTSFHKPYTHQNLAYFEDLAEKRINEMKPKGYKSYYKKKDAFGALMYMDYAIQQCFENYRKRDDFEQTIFVIVGDHSLRMLTNDSRLEKYQVPLIIYSPLLRKTGRFKNVVCQKDVPSALQALLRDNFNLDLPTFSISQSDNLKTQVNFESTGEHVFMYSGKAMENYLFKEYLLYEDELFRITEQMKLKPIKNEMLLDSMITRLKDYRVLSNYVCQKNKFIHKKYYDQFISHKSFLQVNDNFDGAYALDENYKFKNYITDLKYASSPRSLSNKKEHYFKLIENLEITSNSRIRLRLKFMISIKDKYPTIYVVSSDSTEQMLFQKSIQIEQPYCIIRETNNEDWVSIETAVWIETISDPQFLNVYFHQADKAEFFIDNLKIQVKEF